MFISITVYSYTFLFIYLSICLSVCLSGGLFIYLAHSFHIDIIPHSVHLYYSLSVSLSLSLSLSLSIYLSHSVHIHLSLSVYIYIYIHLYIYIYLSLSRSLSLFLSFSFSLSLSLPLTLSLSIYTYIYISLSIYLSQSLRMQRILCNKGSLIFFRTENNTSLSLTFHDHRASKQSPMIISLLIQMLFIPQRTTVCSKNNLVVGRELTVN